MKNSSSIEDDIDLFALLEILWAKKSVILLMPVIFFCASTTYFLLLAEKQYITQTIAVAPNNAKIGTFYKSIAVAPDTSKTSWFDRWGRIDRYAGSWDIFGIGPQDWLWRLEREINNPELLYKAFKWTQSSSDIALNWQQTRKGNHNDQHYFEDFRSRITTTLAADQLEMLFVTDRANSGVQISEHILNEAQNAALTNLQADYLLYVANYFESTSLRVAETWYALAVLNEEPPSILSDYDSEKMMNLVNEIGVLSTTLKSAAEKTLQNMLRQPVSSIAELSIILPPLTSSEPLKTGVERHIASFTILGFFIGIVIILIMSGFEQRQRSKQISTEE